MKKKSRSTQINHALVKFEVVAAHFTPAYSFERFSDVTAAALAASIFDVFRSKVDEAVFDQGLLNDEDLAVELAELDQRLKAITKCVDSDGDLSRLDGFGDSICVAYPRYKFEVLATNQDDQFAASALSALQEDADFSYFIESQTEHMESAVDSEHTTEEQLLALEFSRLTSLPAEEIADQDILDFLDREENLVINEEM